MFSLFSGTALSCVNKGMNKYAVKKNCIPLLEPLPHPLEQELFLYHNFSLSNLAMTLQ